ncbi:MAG: RecQ family ATP-dependent DNA helicase, partial [Flavobacteriaceae bacterium]|nr:RecQ family ATP-dependent DNA helicase [Flavobacteriaceae bacterium]
FKPLQEDIIHAVLSGQDVFALLPTGGGKSLCYQIPALQMEGICLVISPLIALMKDQVEALKEKGIKALALTSDYRAEDIDTMLDNCIYGNYKFLYLSPERLQQDLVQGRIKQMHVNLIAVDEAHCISSWGHDFRPAYRDISILREFHPEVNMIALTATARPKVVQDITTELQLQNPQIFKKSFKRENLALQVFDEEDKYERLERLLTKHTGSSIIYVRNRKSTVHISDYLNSKDISSVYYHGGLANKEKTEHFQDWKSDRVQVMVATNAFGMGIDKADVMTVIHINLPESLESYYQEAGRAGRNSEPAYAVILKNEADTIRVKNQFLKVLPDVKLVKLVYHKLCTYFQVAYGEQPTESFDFNFDHFCKHYELNGITAYNALKILDRNSIIAMNHQFENQTNMQILLDTKALFDYMAKRGHVKEILQAFLRTYGGIFDITTKVNINLIANKVNREVPDVIRVLRQLEQDEVIDLTIAQTDARITFLEPREDDKTVNRISHIIEQQNKLKHDQIKNMLKFVNNDQQCLSIQLLTYFGEKDVSPCGICTVCDTEPVQTTHTKTVEDISHIQTLLAQSPLSSRQILQQSRLSEKRLTLLIKLMLEKNLIGITETNTYKLLTK